MRLGCKAQMLKRDDKGTESRGRSASRKKSGLIKSLDHKKRNCTPMGLLDDLKQEAERIRAEGEESRSVQARREAFYRNETKPALLRILDFLIALLEQIEVIAPEIHGQFRLPGYRSEIQALQSLPSLILDSRDNIKTTGLSLKYTRDNLDFTVSPRDKADDTRAFLSEARQTFSDWPVRAIDGEIAGLHFSIARLQIPAFLEISADIDNQRIRFVSSNIRSFHRQVDYLSPGSIDEDWLDRLGLYLLGQGPSPARLELANEERAALQRMIEEEKAQRERELAEADRLLREEEEAARLSTRMRKLIDTAKDRLPFKPGK